MHEQQPPGLDPQRLSDHLDRVQPGLVRGPLTARLIEGGRSNLTYEVTDGRGRWVLRRPPLGHVLATAHDMVREHRVITALRPTPVPVPDTLTLCADPDVLGAPFYLMEYVEGTPYRSAAQLAALGPEGTSRLVRQLPRTLSELHAVAPESVGLADFGRPEGFLERQLRRWDRQLAASLNRELPGVAELRATLGRRRPDSPTATVLHGDFRLDNVLAGPDGRITAVLDWEMSTLGDPLTDLGLLAMYSDHRMPPGSPISTTREAPGHPTADELVEAYAQASGRDVSAIAWYTAFAYFKLAVILEGIHHRYTLGQTVGPGFDQIGALVPLFVDSGLATLRKA